MDDGQTTVGNGIKPVHHGKVLREEFEALGMSLPALTGRIEVPVNRITEILNGQRSGTSDTALRLGSSFGTSEKFWLNLQMLYELRLGAQRQGAVITRLASPDAGRNLCATG